MRRVPSVVSFPRAALALTIALSFAGGRAFAADETAPIVVPTAGGTPWTADDVAHLRADLDATLARGSGIAHAHVGVVALDTATGTVLYERHADEDFAPASTLKLVVGSAAIDLLGPTFAPTTSAVDVNGILVFDGGADPFFGSAELDDLAAAIAAGSDRRFTDVAVRRGSHDDEQRPSGWTFDDFAQDYAAAITAATFDENVVHVRVTADPDREPAVLLASTAAVPVIATNEASCSARSEFIVDRATAGTGGGTDTIDAEVLPAGCVAITGSLAGGNAPSDIDVAIPDPPSFVARAIVARLRAAGVAVAGEGRSIERDEDVLKEPHPTSLFPPVWIHHGLPLAAVMPRFWIPSDNFVGELLLLHLCAGGSLSRPCGLEVERTWLRSIGVDPATTTLADGSGLSQYDRITPRDLVTILQHDWNGPNRQLVLDSLPIGGARGTIEGIAGTPAAGRVFAKTGSMMHVRGLAGYLATARHGAVTFAFEVDDWIGDYGALAATRAAVLSRIVRN